MDSRKFVIFLAALLALVATVLGKEKTHYEILGVDEDASEAQIKKVYKKLVLKYHPDKAPKDSKKEHQEKFIKINTAYEILSDKVKRKNYDKEREMEKHGFRGFHSGGNTVFGGDSMFGGFNDFVMHFSNPFDSEDFGHESPFETFRGFGDAPMFMDSGAWTDNHHPSGYQHMHYRHSHSHSHDHAQNCQAFVERVGNTVRKTVQCF